MKLPGYRTISVLYLLPALVVLAAWVLILFGSGGTSAWGTLKQALSQHHRYWFWWFLSLPLFFLSLSAAYWWSDARSLPLRVVLFVLGAILVAACAYTVTTAITIAALPALILSLAVVVVPLLSRPRVNG